MKEKIEPGEELMPHRTATIGSSSSQGQPVRPACSTCSLTREASFPVDGPMYFSTPYISVQWALRFEFFTTPAHVDLARFEHPLLVEEREKGDRVLPITVYAPPPCPQPATKSENLSLGGLWVRT